MKSDKCDFCGKESGLLIPLGRYTVYCFGCYRAYVKYYAINKENQLGKLVFREAEEDLKKLKWWRMVRKWFK